MKQLRLKNLNMEGPDHILKGIIPGKYLCKGNLSFKPPLRRTHDIGCTCASCDGKGRHVHDDYEVFIVLQGKAHMEIDGTSYQMMTGDVMVCEPGEDHHLLSDKDDPCINLWLHAADERCKDQLPK